MLGQESAVQPCAPPPFLAPTHLPTLPPPRVICNLRVALSYAWGGGTHLASGVILSCDGAEVVSGAGHEDAAAGSVRHAGPLRPLSGEGLLRYSGGGAESGLIKRHSSIDIKEKSQPALYPRSTQLPNLTDIYEVYAL